MLTRFKTNSCCAFFILLTIGVHGAYAKCNQKINDGVQKIIDMHRIYYQIPGLEVSISCPGEDSPRDFVSGTTTLDGDTPLNSKNLIQIGSETKSFIAAVLLQLEAEEVLSLNNPIGKWLPNIAENWQDITIRQLLNHTSGIFNYFESAEFFDVLLSSNYQKYWTPNELVQLAMNEALYFDVGWGWHYSDTNYVVAGMIIQVATGNSVEEEIKTRLIEPLQLSDTYYLPYPYSKEIMQRMAHGYFNRDGFPLSDATEFNMSMADAAGAIVSTSHDTTIWLKKLLTSNSVLTQEQRNELMSLVAIDDGQPLPHSSKKMGYGLGITRGFDAYGGEIWGHTGGTHGYLSNMMWLKCNDVVITSTITINSGNNGSYALLNDLIDYVQGTDTSKKCTKGIFAEKPVWLEF